jgi:hypothetical protein
MRTKLRWFFIVFIAFLVLAAACTTRTTTPPATATTTSPSIYSQYELSYLLLAKYPDYFWCDPDYYPVAREGAEQSNALAQFPTIQSNTAEFKAILAHLGIDSQTTFSDQDKLNIYRDHKKLTIAAPLTPSGNLYTFSLRTGSGQGQTLLGTIAQSGTFSIQSQQTSFNTCPICLSRGTLIATPQGQIPVELLAPGILVWTQNSLGERVAEPLLQVSNPSVPVPFNILRFILSDARSLTASPGHPTVQGRTLGELAIGDTLDSAQIISIELVVYRAGMTFDLLPAGATGYYWANNILLASTLKIP